MNHLPGIELEMQSALNFPEFSLVLGALRLLDKYPDILLWLCVGPQTRGTGVQ